MIKEIKIPAVRPYGTVVRRTLADTPGIEEIKDMKLIKETRSHCT